MVRDYELKLEEVKTSNTSVGAGDQDTLGEGSE